MAKRYNFALFAQALKTMHVCMYMSTT